MHIPDPLMRSLENQIPFTTHLEVYQKNTKKWPNIGLLRTKGLMPKWEYYGSIILTLYHPDPSLISKMCYEVFDESQKWSWYTKKSCKTQCVDLVHMVGNRIKIPNQSWKIKNRCENFGISCTMRWYNFHYLILLILKNQL